MAIARLWLCRHCLQQWRCAVGVWEQ